MGKLNFLLLFPLAIPRDIIRKLQVVLLLMAFGVPISGFADDSEIVDEQYTTVKESKNIISERITKENNGKYVLTPYKPSYFLFGYYTQKPYNSIYLNSTPDNQNIKQFDAKLQFSFKVPIWQDIFNKSSNLNLAYTQVSYWQAYNHSAFFRETNYEPEIFLANNIDGRFLPGWKFNYLNIGVTHQSNGKGGNLERSWERVYLEGIFANEHWMVSLKPWYPIREATAHIYNPDIAYYLGYGRMLVAYKHDSAQVLSLEVRNAAESRFKRGAVQVDWSFPLTQHISGYVQGFSGYGQSLIEYNHYTNSVGVGIALNHWL